MLLPFVLSVGGDHCGGVVVVRAAGIRLLFMVAVGKLSRIGLLCAVGFVCIFCVGVGLKFLLVLVRCVIWRVVCWERVVKRVV